MIILIIVSETSNKYLWEQKLKTSGRNGTIFQSTYWAEYLNKEFRDQPIYIRYLDKKGNIQGLLLAFESCFGKHSSLTSMTKKGIIFKHFFNEELSNLLHILFPNIFWENGPIILLQDSVKERIIYKNMLEKIIKIAEVRNCYKIKFARPPFFQDYNSVYFGFGFNQKTMGTLLIDLKQTEKSIWKGMKREARRNIRRSLEKGLLIDKIEKRSRIIEFYNLNKNLNNMNGTKLYPISYFNSLWDYFSPLNKMRIYITYYLDFYLNYRIQ
jgi:hypothetical protein